ncbi:hypothetical protein AAA799P11_00728 [Marine Group I thaumarchaeote SCGC AAA799-P11]|uniref:Uncharacterized protein n=1 Tax=Marine Group I thaumarchaeote SCGC AAA799-P11 TaxID=1502295 RepID=A0A087S1C3_9ARCH|nr:hypothetical protein AAA799P11_00728 [Marine Group I thaumarchaeote SCGC AAA799-P11]
MKLEYASIRIIDYLDSDNLKKFEKELEQSDIFTVEKDNKWEETSISQGRRKTIASEKHPPELEFIESIQIDQIQYKNFSSAIMLVIEGTLSQEIFEKLMSQDINQNQTLLKQFQVKLWNYWKKNITSTYYVTKGHMVTNQFKSTSSNLVSIIMQNF